MGGTTNSDECRDRVQNRLTTDPGEAHRVRESRNASIGSGKTRFDTDKLACSHSECGNGGHSSDCGIIGIVGWRRRVVICLRSTAIRSAASKEAVETARESLGKKRRRVAMLLETSRFMIAQLAAEAAR